MLVAAAVGRATSSQSPPSSRRRSSYDATPVPISVAAGQLTVTGTELAAAVALFWSRATGGNVSGGEVSGSTVTSAVAVREPTVAVTEASPGSSARNSPVPDRVPALPVLD